jgi:hypothetical protein
MASSRLLQMNKKWGHLKRSQQIWIHAVTQEEIAAYTAEHRYFPGTNGRDIILDKVCERISERGIWLPYGEIKTHVCKVIAKTKRKYMSQAVKK